VNQDRYEPDVEDIAAMRAENGGADLKQLLRAQINAGRTRRDAPLVTAPPPPPPGHRPGSWPSGTSPPGPLPPAPPGAWEAAVHRYHHDIPDSGPCECPGCQPTNQTEENQ
jgi:hypothetical protein